MLSNQEMYLSLDDISIVPAVTTSIKHRSECNIYYENYKLPIFTAPMSSIVNMDNANIFDSAGINVIIPRTVDFDNRLKLSNRYFIAVGLDEFENKILALDLKDSEPIKICLDVANGHMTQLLDLCQECVNVNTSRKLTVGTTNMNKLANVYVKLTNEPEEDETLPKIPMVQCESTDEGAMLIKDYMLLKNWSLA